MVKLKTDTYVSLHRAKSLLENEKDVIALILDNKVDDLYSLLSDVDKARLKKFATDIMHDITVFCDEVNYILEDLHKKTVTRKDFALNFKHIDDTMRTFVFANWDSRCTIESVITFVMSHLGSNRSFQKCNTIIKHDW
jgi:hypothetical protein